jgi:hypothetical protein
MIKIPYSKVEQIIESHLIQFEGRIYETVEDLQTFPDTLTLKDSPMSREEFWDAQEKLETLLRGW